MWILKLKSVDSEAKKCGFVKKNSHFFYCLIPKVWFNFVDVANINQKNTFYGPEKINKNLAQLV